MKKFKSIVIILLKNFINNAKSSLNVKNNKLIALLQLVLIGAIFVPAVYLSIVTFEAFAQINQPELVVTSMYVNSIILMFFLGIPIIVSVFFFSKDTRFLISLPIKEETIIFAKLSTIYLFLLAISAAFVLPSIVVYAINTTITLSIIIGGLLAFILAPLLPLLISSLLILIFNKIVRKSKYKNLLTITGNLMLIIAIIVIQMMVSKNAANPELIQNAFLNNESLIGIIGVSFPPSIWMTKMILGSFINTIYFIGINILFVIILQLMAKYFFKKSLLSLSHASNSTKKIYYTNHSKEWQLLKRHVLIIVQEPTFLLNTLLTMLVPLILYVVMSFSGDLSLEVLNSKQMNSYMVLIYSGIIIMPTIVSNISSTAITREGKAFWQTKVLPISNKMNIKYRIITSLIINFLGSLIVGIVGYFMLTLSMKIIIIGIYFAVTTTLFLTTIDFIINIYRPLLNWSHPTAAVKNNLNVTLALGIRFAIGIIVFGLYKLYPDMFNNYDLLLIAMGSIFLVLYLVTRFILYNYYIEKFSKISL
ncbi:MAG: hypothetical protein K9K32_02285 [Halanaerobiales bacterium]|nr:hypothetical protein [Halanaerobiales bacterium]